MNAHTQPPVVADALAGLLGRLRRSLSELKGKGYEIRWITVGGEELERLFVEGGDDIVYFDPDPASDRAWFDGVELRPTEHAGCFIYLEGEYAEMSRHCI